MWKWKWKCQQKGEKFFFIKKNKDVSWNLRTLIHFRYDEGRFTMKLNLFDEKCTGIWKRVLKYSKEDVEIIKRVCWDPYPILMGLFLVFHQWLIELKSQFRIWEIVIKIMFSDLHYHHWAFRTFQYNGTYDETSSQLFQCSCNKRQNESYEDKECRIHHRFGWRELKGIPLKSSKNPAEDSWYSPIRIVWQNSNFGTYQANKEE